jgi:diguanylate cyclase (GGDEF)-like protein
MVANAFALASNELRERFIKLLDSLSTVRALTSLDVHHQDESALLDGALKVLVQHQNLERCSAFLLRGTTLVRAARRDYSDLFQEETQGAAPCKEYLPATVPLGEGIVGLAAKTRELQWCQDCSTDPRIQATDDGAALTRGSMMSAPLMNGDDVLGVVTLYHEEPGFFQDWHRYVLVVFCNILGHMLANSRVMQHLEELVESRTRQLESTLAEAEHLKRRYEELSIRDELTGLHNRRYFFDQAESALAHCIRHANPFCLISVDIDFFKKINDTYGHAAGDSALRDLARVLQRHTRQDDTLARFGGEEFIISLPTTDLSGAKTVARRIREHVHKLEWRVNAQCFGTSVSMGIALAEPPFQGRGKALLETLVQQADEALYFSKANGRDQANAYPELPESGKTASDS